MPSLLNRSILSILCLWGLLMQPLPAFAEDTTSDPLSEQLEQSIEQLQQPLYQPFIERYVLDDLRSLRQELAAQKAELIQQMVDRELSAVDRAVRYATDTITYFFYLIAAASSILVIVGWTSMRDIKAKAHELAEREISKLVTAYEGRLQAIETTLNQKTRSIDSNRKEIERTQEIHSLWLRAAQETNHQTKISIYDSILSLQHDNCEALTYKADTVLDMGEPQWAANLCHQALLIDPENTHAFYQLACAYTAIGKYQDAVNYLERVLEETDRYQQDIIEDEALAPLKEFPPFRELMQLDSVG